MVAGIVVPYLDVSCRCHNRLLPHRPGLDAFQYGAETVFVIFEQPPTIGHSRADRCSPASPYGRGLRHPRLTLGQRIAVPNMYPTDLFGPSPQRVSGRTWRARVSNFHCPPGRISTMQIPGPIVAIRSGNVFGVPQTAPFDCCCHRRHSQPHLGRGSNP